MKMEQPVYLLLTISVWFLLQPTPSEQEVCVLPTNVKISLHPGLINVTWDCNMTSSMEKRDYRIQVDNNIIIKLDGPACFFKYLIPCHMDITIHKGFNAEMYIRNGNCSSVHITVMPEGEENSAAENFSCVVHSVSVVNCSWTAGSEAPKDTQYSLAFRHEEKVYRPCEDYRTDSFGRQVGCVFRAPPFKFDISCYVQLEGTSKETPIRFFDALLKLDHFTLLDPPRNIILNHVSNELNVSWVQPETHRHPSNNCFLYSININGEITDDLMVNFYRTRKLRSDEKVEVSMRVRWHSHCSDNKDYSRWSQSFISDPSRSTQVTPQHLLILLGVVTASLLFLLIFLCHRFRIWKKLFPKVPQPAVKLFQQAGQKESSEQTKTNTEMPYKKDIDEECICSPITEIPQEDQLAVTA